MFVIVCFSVFCVNLQHNLLGYEQKNVNKISIFGLNN